MEKNGNQNNYLCSVVGNLRNAECSKAFDLFVFKRAMGQEIFNNLIKVGETLTLQLSWVFLKYLDWPQKTSKGFNKFLKLGVKLMIKSMD